jgi:hypothetical protein
MKKALLKPRKGGIIMNIRKKWLAGVLCICFVAAAHVAAAETDLRVKLGSAAGVDKTEFATSGEIPTSQADSGNFQIEVAFSPEQGPVNFVGTIGLFGRNHKGNIPDPVFPTEVEYRAGGLSGSAGVSIKANENVHFEGRVELALGSGKPTLTTPFAVFNPVKEGSYGATTLILGGYVTLSTPGLQLGLELGAQSFVGNFQIWNDTFGFWEDAKVKGSGGTANLVIGYRF